MHILEASVRLKKQLNLNIPKGNLLYHSFSMTERQIIEEKNKKRRQCIQFFFCYDFILRSLVTVANISQRSSPAN